MNKFDIIYEAVMNSLLCEATTKIEHDQINSIRKQLKKLGINKKFYVQLPNGEKAGPFNKIRQISRSAKTCKADAEIYNSDNKDVKSIFISLKDYAFRQFGGREDLFGGKIYKNTKEEANEKILQNEFIKSKHDLIKSIFKEMNAIKTKNDKDICDFIKLKNKIKKFKIPMFSFRIPDEELEFFNPCKFGFDMLSTSESGINNVDVILIGEINIKKLDNSTVEITAANEKSSIEWNVSLYGETSKNQILEKHRMYLCFLFDDRNHTFGDFINCRFAIWPEYKVHGWIHEEDIEKFLNEKIRK